MWQLPWEYTDGTANSQHARMHTHSVNLHYSFIKPATEFRHYLCLLVPAQHNITNFKELGPFWEAASCAATQEFLNILWNPKVHYHVHGALHWSLSWARSIQSIPPHPTSIRSILILSTHLHLVLPSGFFPSWFSHQYPPCPAQLTFLD
jgi:hypothetical protein